MTGSDFLAPAACSKSVNPQVAPGRPCHSPDSNADARSSTSYESCDHNLTITSGDVNWLDMDAKKANNLSTIIGHSVNKNCENFSLRDTFLSFVPLVQRLRTGYGVRDLVADIVAGITIAILQIPQGIAYALLVGVAPAYGLYTSFFPVSNSC